LLGDLPDYVSDFFKQYRRPIVTVGLILAAVLAVKIVLALLDAVDDTPIGPQLGADWPVLYRLVFIPLSSLKASNRLGVASTIFPPSVIQVLRGTVANPRYHPGEGWNRFVPGLS
jgi:hypothetical protein